MDLKELKNVINLLAKQHSLDKNLVLDFIKESFLTLINKKYSKMGKDATNSFDMVYDDNGELVIYHYRKYVEKVSDNFTEIDKVGLREHNVDPEEYKIGESLGTPWDLKNFNRNEINILKQILSQKISQNLREKVLNNYKSKEHTYITAMVKHVTPEGALVSVGTDEALLPKEEYIRDEVLNRGDRLSFYVKKVGGGQKGKEIILSRKTPQLVIEILKEEVQEFKDRTIELVDIARIPGEKTKIVLKSNDRNTDAVGTCVGQNAFRLEKIREILDGDKKEYGVREQVEFIEYKENKAEFLQEVVGRRIEIQEAMESDDKFILVVDNKDLGSLIGKRSANLKLSSTLLQKSIFLYDSEEFRRYKNDLRKFLVDNGIGDLHVQELFNMNIISPDDLKLYSEANEELSDKIKKIIGKDTLPEFTNVLARFSHPAKQYNIYYKEDIVDLEQRRRELLNSFKS